MRFLMAVAAFLIWIPVASAGQVVSTYGVTNLKSTDWSATNCNGTQTVLQCTLNGSDASGESGDAGMGDNGKH